MFKLMRVIVAVLLAAAAVPASAEDVFYHLSMSDLKIVEGSLPASDEANWGRWWDARNRPAYAVLDGEGEVYVKYNYNTRRTGGRSEAFLDREIAVRVPQARDITGRLFLPKWQGNGMVVARFKIAADQTGTGDRTKYFELMLAHYEQLLRQRAPGAAWFRHQVREARAELGRDTNEIATNQPGRPRTDELSDTYAMFTGGRAMSENLQLDRVLQPTQEGVESVALDSIEGITVREIDWKPLIKGMQPELDPLAARIPFDQHAVFFPTFEAAVALSDEMAEQGAPLLLLAEPRSTSARTFERYQQQMCLTLTAMARLLGPSVVRSVAVTGSDPYFPTGTDVAVLFEAEDAATLEKLLLAQVSLAMQGKQNVQRVEGELGGLAYQGARSEDRSICSYVARMNGVVIVSNSLRQLEQFIQVSTGKTNSLASLDEYMFFRNRYPRGDASETAFLFLSDAAIRRWCGPKWRIATSRRTRDAAVMAELQAGQLDRLVAGNVRTGPIYTDLPIGGENDITLTPSGVRGSSIGSLAFMTPISEMKIDRVTKSEADAYRRWRDRYQSNWRWAFDPIGLRIGIEQHRLSADLTVMPLIWGSDYRELISYSQGAAFKPDEGDIHDTLAHLIMAINTDSPELKRQANFARMLTGNVEIEPLSWLGDNVGVYVEQDPFWKELSAVDRDDLDQFMEEQGWRIPLAVRAEVSSGLKLTLFLSAVRAFIEQASPGMLNWESLTYQEQPYVKITPTERAIGQSEEIRNLAVYYSASGQALTVTLNEDVLKRSIDRDVARLEAKKEDRELPSPEHSWLGSNLALQVDQQILNVIASVTSSPYQRAMQNRAWSNLPILNEWKQRYGDRDPVALHQAYWHEKLVCPGGGEYVWNEKYQTMESTVYGCPAAPKAGPAAPPQLTAIKQGSFGLTFEEQGLRTQVELDR